MNSVVRAQVAYTITSVSVKKKKKKKIKPAEISGWARVLSASAEII